MDNSILSIYSNQLFINSKVFKATCKTDNFVMHFMQSTFQNIDNDVITYDQSKTGIPVGFMLAAPVDFLSW